MRSLPNIVVMAPKDENELQHMLATAIEYPGPAAIRFPRGSGIGIPLDPEIKAIPVGESELLRDGDDVLLCAYGTMVHPAMEAAQDLAGQGVSAAVLNARFAKPLDRERLLPLMRRCGAVVTLEEHSSAGGFGSAVLELVDSEQLDLRTRCLAIREGVVEHGNTLGTVGLEPEDVVRAVLELLRGRATDGV
jgi:1-deoxy-D-xylulose-5-phosphate synthase